MIEVTAKDIKDGFFNMCLIPDVTRIGPNAFWGCKALTDINIPNNVTHIGDGAFWGCKALKTINIPDNVTHIGDGAFWGCESLKIIKIPDSVIRIDDYTFCEYKGNQFIFKRE